MTYRTKQEQIRDFIALEIISGKLKDGDKLYAKKFFTNKFKVNPHYVDLAISSMIKAGFVFEAIDYYYLIVNDDIIRRLKDEFSNRFINEFLDNMNSLGLDYDKALRLLEMRGMVLKKPTLKYFVVMLEFSSISIIFVFSSPLCSLNFLRIKAFAKRGA